MSPFPLTVVCLSLEEGFFLRKATYQGDRLERVLHHTITNRLADLVSYFVRRMPQIATSVRLFQSLWLLPCPTIRT